MRQNISSGAKWEDIVGYSRAVRIGGYIWVAGTTAAGKTMYEQASNALGIIEGALRQAGASMRDVVRTRMFITDISQWEEAGRAHGEYFRDVKPAATMVEVSKLIDPELWIEIEVDAFVAP